MRIRTLALLLSTLALALPAAATTYVMVSDAALADQAEVVLEARVVDATSSPAAGLPSTDYTIEVERVVGGTVTGSTLIVRVPGGVGPDGIGRKIWGAPAFAPGERTLLFLAARKDGTYRVLHLALGAFRVAEAGGRRIAARDLAGTHEVRISPLGEVESAPGTERPRDLDLFARWVADRRAGVEREPDYFTELAGKGEEMERIADPFTLLVWPGNGLPIRWFEFDSGGSVDFHAHEGGQPGVSGGGFDDVQRAIAAWNADPATPIRYTFRGTTEATGGFSDSDGINGLLFEDPNGDIEDEFSCEEGGILAIGGPAFDPDFTGTFNGRTFIRALEADVVTNDGLGCFFEQVASSNKVAEQLFAHELGHTLGLGHSCDEEGSTTDTPSCGSSAALDDALMRWLVHVDARGAALKADDRAAIASVYKKSAAANKKPVAPRGLKATIESSTEVGLVWTDRSNNETTFRVEVKVNKGSFREIGAVDAGITAVTVVGLSPKTQYTFRVRARNEKGNSGYSNQAKVKTPAG